MREITPRLKKNILSFGLTILIFLAIIEVSVAIFYPFISNGEFSRDRISQKLSENEGLSKSENDTIQNAIKDNFTRKDYKKIILHPFLGFIQTPEENHKFYDSDIDYKADITGKINEYGFDGPSNIPKKAPGKVIICMLGGSFSMYFYHEAKEKLIEELKKSPLFANKKIEIYCYASSGYKEPQQLMALNYFISLGGEYDIVINLDGINDIALPITDNIQYSLFPFFPRFWYVFSNRVSNAESNLLFAEIVKDRESKSQYKSFFNHFPLSFSNTGLVLWEILDRRLDYKINMGYDKYVKSVFRSMKEKNIENYGPKFDYSLPREKQFQLMASFWKQCSKMIDALSVNMKFKYFHFLQPNQHLAESKSFSDDEKMFAGVKSNNPGDFNNIASNGYPYLINSGKELKNEGVEFEDLTMIFKNHKETIYRDPCCHINMLGNEIIAKKMAETIIKNMSLKNYKLLN